MSGLTPHSSPKYLPPRTLSSPLLDKELSPARREVPARRTLETIFEEAAARPSPPNHIKKTTPAPDPGPKRRPAPEGEGYQGTKRARILNDKLGEYIRSHSNLFLESEWDEVVRTIRKRGDLEVQPGEGDIPHPALGLLKSFQRTGVPVVLSTAPWGAKKRRGHVQRGAHQSCKDHLEFIRTEMLDFVKKGYWMVLPYRLVQDLAQLRLSPLGVVPQRERRPRLIVDYTYNGVNEDTVKMVPPEAMQFGRALERVLYAVHHANPHHGPVYIAKTDLADGFYRVPLSTSGIPKLGVILPRFPNEEQLVAFPLVLPMGWVESPPAFCAATETVADLANNLSLRDDLPKHPLEEVANTNPKIDPNSVQSDPPQNRSATDDSPPRPVLRPFRRPVALHDIYMDDFISLIQGSSPRRQRHMRRLLHFIDRVFRPLDAYDSPERQHVASIKKFQKGDG